MWGSILEAQVDIPFFRFLKGLMAKNRRTFISSTELSVWTEQFRVNISKVVWPLFKRSWENSLGQLLIPPKGHLNFLYYISIKIVPYTFSKVKLYFIGSSFYKNLFSYLISYP